MLLFRQGNFDCNGKLKLYAVARLSSNTLDLFVLGSTSVAFGEGS